MTPTQCRMARAGLRWGVRDLAALARVSAATVIRFENGQATPIAATLEAIRRAFEDGGAEFREGDGVRIPARPPAAPVVGAGAGSAYSGPTWAKDLQPAEPVRVEYEKPSEPGMIEVAVKYVDE